VGNPTVERRDGARYRGEVSFGLEALGGDVLLEGHVEDLSRGGVRAIVPSLLPAAGRAFVVITVEGQLPIVGMIQVVAQTVLADTANVELRAHFVDLSPDNRERLDKLCAPDTSQRAG
jgi:PilZ domain